MRVMKSFETLNQMIQKKKKKNLIRKVLKHYTK